MIDGIDGALDGQVGGYALCMTAGILIGLLFVALGLELLALHLVQPWDAELIALSDAAAAGTSPIVPPPRCGRD